MASRTSADRVGVGDADRRRDQPLLGDPGQAGHLAVAVEGMRAGDLPAAVRGAVLGAELAALLASPGADRAYQSGSRPAAVDLGRTIRSETQLVARDACIMFSTLREMAWSDNLPDCAPQARGPRVRCGRRGRISPVSLATETYVTLAPGEVLDMKDPGDDVQLRFRYQHAYAAIQCLKLIGSSPEFVAVYCENYEDVLLRRKNGTYVGVQVKTRQFEGEPFKATDADVIKSIARFARLERDFPDQFDAYHFVTNHVFWTKTEDEHCPAHILSLAQGRGGVKGLRKTNTLRAYVLDVCDKHDCEEAHVASALCKLRLDGYGSDLERSYRDLIDVVAATGDLGSHSHGIVCRIADNLLFHAYKASSCILGGGVAALYELVSDFNKHRHDLVLAGKTFTAETVHTLINKSLRDTAENLLVSAKLVPAAMLSLSVDILTEKLEHGGLQTERIDKIKDYKASIESLYFRWRYRSGLDEANRRLTHLKVLVEDDCIEAKLATENGSTFAPAMYTNLRQRLGARVADNRHSLFGATEEHLLGTAGVLTEECRVWWSERFDLSSRLVL